jgi:tRNA threonylcarbamoyladenosine biosynthesis protein TsaE
MEIKRTIISKSLKESAKFAEAFVGNLIISKNKLKSATVVGLSGDLGTGKTAFTQAAAKHLGIKSKVNSPTFVIMKRYPIRAGNTLRALAISDGASPIKHHQFKFLYHLDAYRLKNAKELLHLGWREMVKNPENIIFIEWPENVKTVMPKKYHKIRISHTKEGYRNFKI